jgi:hypothetical protein
MRRQKQKNLLEGVVSQRDSLQQRLYQAEVQVGRIEVHCANWRKADAVDVPDKRVSKSLCSMNSFCSELAPVLCLSDVRVSALHACESTAVLMHDCMQSNMTSVSWWELLVLLCPAAGVVPEQA